MLQKTGRHLITQNNEVREIDALLVVTYSNRANAPDRRALEYFN
jgi:hypothetical protein